MACQACAEGYLEMLCRERVMAPSPEEWAGSCVRMKGHNGPHQMIRNGMSAAEAEHITKQDCPVCFGEV